MSDQNCINITGMVLKNPEKIGDNGAKFSVINGRGTKNKPITNFFNCVAWDKQADLVMKYVTEKMRIAITGEMNSRKYEEKTYWDVTIRDFVFLSKGKKAGDKPAEEKPSGEGYEEVDPKDVPPVDFDADIPW